jgi:PPOX class probable F420-dependent enzyme
MPKPPLPDPLHDFLARPNPAVMGTIRANGDPVTVATWYLWEDGRVLLNLDERRKRLQHLRRDPRVSLTVLGDENWYHHVSLHCRVASLADDPDLVDIDRLAQHYRGSRYGDRVHKRVSAWLDVDSWHAWGLSAARGRR